MIHFQDISNSSSWGHHSQDFSGNWGTNSSPRSLSSLRQVEVKLGGDMATLWSKSRTVDGNCGDFSQAGKLPRWNSSTLVPSRRPSARRLS